MNGNVKWQKEIDFIRQKLNDSKREHADSDNFILSYNCFSMFITDYIRSASYSHLISFRLFNKKTYIFYKNYNRDIMIYHSDKVINYIARKLYEYNILENL